MVHYTAKNKRFYTSFWEQRIDSCTSVPLRTILTKSLYRNPASKRRAADRATSPVSPLTVRSGEQAMYTVRSWSSRVSYPLIHATGPSGMLRNPLDSPPPSWTAVRRSYSCATSRLLVRRLRRPCSRPRFDDARGLPRRRVLLLCHTPPEVRGERRRREPRTRTGCITAERGLRAMARGAATRRSTGRADGRQCGSAGAMNRPRRSDVGATRTGGAAAPCPHLGFTRLACLMFDKMSHSAWAYSRLQTTAMLKALSVEKKWTPAHVKIHVA